MSLEVRLILDQTIIEECLLFTFLSITMSSLIGLGYFCVCVQYWYDYDNRVFLNLCCQVLDAPALQDDFYLNLVDWSAQNVLAVGLGNCVYLWNASSSKVNVLLLFSLSNF